VVGSLQELKDNPGLWRPGASCPLAPQQGLLKVAFEVPVLAGALLLELPAFHVGLQEASQELLQCPRCSQVIQERHGICRWAARCRPCLRLS
jgi:E3 ubiquitin-protein ligase UBR4